jgi:hypothetical protein
MTWVLPYLRGWVCLCPFIDDHFGVYFHCRTWYVGGPTIMSQTRGALQGCIYAGLIYAAVETLPVAVLGSELPCGSCGTEEWFPPFSSPPSFSLFLFWFGSWLVFATASPVTSFQRILIVYSLPVFACFLLLIAVVAQGHLCCVQSTAVPRTGSWSYY